MTMHWLCYCKNLICQYKKSRETDPLTIKNAEKDIHLKKFHCCYKNGMCLFVILKWPWDFTNVFQYDKVAKIFCIFWIFKNHARFEIIRLWMFVFILWRLHFKIQTYKHAQLLLTKFAILFIFNKCQIMNNNWPTTFQTKANSTVARRNGKGE